MRSSAPFSPCNFWRGRRNQNGNRRMRSLNPTCHLVGPGQGVFQQGLQDFWKVQGGGAPGAVAARHVLSWDRSSTVKGGPGAWPPTLHPTHLGGARRARRHPKRACQTTPAEKKHGGREAAWRRRSFPGCLHLPLSHAGVANCGNSSQPRRAGPGGWPAWFYRASHSQSGSEELGQLSNFAKAAPFSFPRCYNKSTRWGGGGVESKRALSGVHTLAAYATAKGSSEGLRGGSEELRAAQAVLWRYTRRLHLPANFSSL